MTRDDLFREYERWTSRAADDDDDIRPLRSAAFAHLKTKPPLAEFAPCFAVIYFDAVEFDGSSRLRTWLYRTGVRMWIWLLEHSIFRGRPMWNDFRMALWQLSRDPHYVKELQAHLNRAVRKKYAHQIETGAWMVRSVCRQDPEFKEYWTQLEV